MKISIIVAVSENGVIGRGGALPWRLSDDLRRFKRLTMGHTVIMGRRTWESIGRQLPGRRMMVVSRRPEYTTGVQGIDSAQGLNEALQTAASNGESEAFIIGGAELYRSALPISDRLYVTVVRSNVQGDTYFPVRPDEFDWNSWVIVENEIHTADARNDYPYVFTTLQRCEPKSSAKKQ